MKVSVLRSFSVHVAAIALLLATESRVYCQTARELGESASQKLQAGDARGAISDLDRAVALGPESRVLSLLLVSRGMAKARLGDTTNAIVDFDRAIEIDPRSAGAYNNRGYTKLTINDLPGAIADFDESLRLNRRGALADLATNNRKNAIDRMLLTLLEAIRADNLDEVRALVSAVPAVADAPNALGITPLNYLALETGNENGLAIAELLLEAGADPSAGDSEGNTPLHRAGDYGPSRLTQISDEVYLGLINLLLSHKASVTQRNIFGLTPLHRWTLTDATRPAVELLLDHGAPVRSKTTRDRFTPLHGAAGSGRNDLVELLLARGAARDKSAKDAAGRTPRDIALAGGHQDTAELLQ